MDRGGRDRDWEGEGSLPFDDARSYSSIGAETYRDGTVALYASLRSSGSVGSQESDRGGERGSSHRSYAAHSHASSLVNGETHFPSAMSYVSDAQRSDAATVCSSSVVEDIEVESVLSQDDNPFVSHSPAEKRKSTPKSRLVEFAGVPSDPYAVSTPGPLEHSSQVHAMGPPLSRALLLKVAGASSQSGSVKSYGSAGSDDRRAHSDDGTGSIDVDAPRNKSTNSIRSFEGSEGAHETDDGGSLDVETHSIETRSIHSQDEAAPPEEELAPAPASIPSADIPTASLLHSDELVHGGRQSPGGTIYKGRGTRRYQGRYMNLPLKRFHHNGVHLDTVDELNSNNDTRPYPRPHGDDDAPWKERRRSRSRSRSRSPDDGDRKLRSDTTRFHDPRQDTNFDEEYNRGRR